MSTHVTFSIQITLFDLTTAQVPFSMHSNMTPTKRSNAQHLDEYEKQLLYEENTNSGNVMQQPMISYVFGMNLSSESILIRSYLLFAQINMFLSNSGTPILRKK